MVDFIDENRGTYGVEPICEVLPIAPSTYYERKVQEADPSRRSARAKQDEGLKVEIRRVWDENHAVYGAEKVWRQLNRERIPVARCTVERLMQELGLHGMTRGRAVGLGPDLRGDLARLRLRRLRHRRLRAPDRRLARLELAPQRPGSRRPRASHL